MSQQLSFDFPLDGFHGPRPGGRVPRRQAVAAPAEAGSSPQMDLTMVADGPRPGTVRMQTRPTAVPPVGEAARKSVGTDDAVREWCQAGWTARIVRSEDGDGWGVEVWRDEASEPALQAPWSTVADGAAPAPLDAAAFRSLCKAASDLVRQKQHWQARAQQHLTVRAGASRWQMTLTAVSDDGEPHGLLTACDENGEWVAEERVAPDFRLTEAAARAWMNSRRGEGF